MLELSRSFALSLAALVVMGASDTISVVVQRLAGQLAQPGGQQRADAAPPLESW